MARLGKSFTITKDGKVVKSAKYRSVSDTIREKKSKKTRVVSKAKLLMHDVKK